MSIQGDAAKEGMTQFLCNKLVGKIERYPEATKALKEVGIEILDNLPNIPEWANKYYKIFRA